MDKNEPPIFKNDLSKEEQKKQDDSFEKEKEEKKKLQKMLDIVDGIATGIDIIINH